MAKPNGNGAKAQPVLENPPQPATGPAAASGTAKGRKLSYKDQRDLEALPGRIAALEAEQATITAALSDAALYRDNPQEVKRLNERFADIDAELLSCLERWEALEAQAKG